jgi:hypothetical protein
VNGRLGGVERPRRVVRFARLIHRLGRVLGGPAARAASGGNPMPALVATKGGAAGVRAAGSPPYRRVGTTALRVSVIGGGGRGLAAWRRVGQRFTQHEVDELLDGLGAWRQPGRPFLPIQGLSGQRGIVKVP